MAAEMMKLEKGRSKKRISFQEKIVFNYFITYFLYIDKHVSRQFIFNKIS